MEQPGIKKPSIGQAATLKRRAVRLSQANLTRTSFDSEKPLPLVVESAIEDIDACDWAASNQEFIRANLLKHGGLLLRDFKVKSAAEFERFVKVAGDGELLDYSYRSTPRTRVNRNVFTSTEYPADQFIPLHNEMSYSRSWPMKIFFFA